MKPRLTYELFLTGIATLERYYRRPLKPGDRDIYFEGVRDASDHKWTKVVDYATKRSKTMPKVSELREWMGLGEPPAPVDEDVEHNGKPHIGGMSLVEIKERARRGEPLPFQSPWEHEVEEACYLSAVESDPPPARRLTPSEVQAYIRKYAEAGAEQYAKCRPVRLKKETLCEPATASQQ